jgi:hypothetical protein
MARRTLKIEALDVKKALKKYPFAAKQADRTCLLSKWGVTAVRLHQHSIRLERQMVNLSKGCSPIA